MKEKLELKHLAPYLPYGLHGAVEDFEENTVHLNVKVMSVDIDDLCLSFDECLDVYLDDTKDAIFKPILRPLTDLTKEADKFEEFEQFNIEEFGITRTEMLNSFIESEDRLNICYGFNFWQKLFENHFDVFGLIDKGLAIDINELS